MAYVAFQGRQSSQKRASSLYPCLLMKHLYGGLRKQPGGVTVAGEGGGASPFLQNSRALREHGCPLCPAPTLPQPQPGEAGAPPPSAQLGRPTAQPSPPRPAQEGDREAGPAQQPRLAACHANGRGAETECARGRVRATDGGRAGPGWLPEPPPAPDAWNTAPPVSSEQLLEVSSSSSPRAGNRGKKTEAQQAGQMAMVT